MKAIALALILSLLTTSAFCEQGAEPKHVKGRVLDLKSTKKNPIGIPGVMVEAFDSQGKSLKQTLTDNLGKYELEGIRPGTLLEIRHSKVNYLRDPEPFKGVVAEDGVIVYMAQRNADLSYYKEIGKAMADRSSTMEIVCRLTGTLVYQPACSPEVRVDPQLLEEEQRRLASYGLSSQERDETVIALQEVLVFGRDEPRRPERHAVSSGECFSSTIHFAQDASTLDANARSSLDGMVFTPGCGLIIEGYADRTEIKEQTMELSASRALAVRNYLVSKGVNPGNIRLIYYGERRRQFCVEGGESCVAENRIVKVIAVVFSSRLWR